MRRLARCTVNALTLLSLLPFVATAVLWARSVWVADTWHWSRRDDGADHTGRVGWVDIKTFRGRLGVLVETNSAYLNDYSFGLRHEVEPAAMAEPVGIGRPSGSGLFSGGRQKPFYHVYFDHMGFAYYRDDLDSGYHEHHCIAPLWSIMVVTAAAPALRLRSIGRRQQNRKMKQACAYCGYDLRATPDRCPECGTGRARTAGDG